VFSQRKPHSLGITFTPVEDSLRDCALSIFAKGFLEKVLPMARLDDTGRPINESASVPASAQVPATDNVGAQTPAGPKEED
jgi:hypothetical protein